MGPLISFVSVLGWRPGIKTLLGTDADEFYNALVAADPAKAYEIACSSGDSAFVAAVTERVIQKTVGGTDLEDAIREMYLNTAIGATVPELVRPLVSSSGFSIESLADRYRLHEVPVPYHEGLSVVDISKALLDNGKNHTQREWVTLTREGPWRIPSGPLYHAVCSSALYANEEHPDDSQRAFIDTIKKMLATDVRKGSMTSTRILYNSKKEDTVVHNFGYDDERKISQNIVGPDGFVNKDCSFGSAIEALLGTEDCEKVRTVYSWLVGKESYLWRFKQKPQHDQERALVLGVNNVRFYIYADVDLYGSRPARGVVVRGAKNSPQEIKV